MSGSQLKSGLIEIGVTDAEFSRLSNLSIKTLSKIYADDESIRDTTRNKAITAYRRIRAERTGFGPQDSGDPPSAA